MRTRWQHGVERVLSLAAGGTQPISGLFEGEKARSARSLPRAAVFARRWLCSSDSQPRQLLPAYLPLPVLCAAPQHQHRLPNTPHWLPVPVEPHVLLVLASKCYLANMAQLQSPHLWKASSKRAGPLLSPWECQHCSWPTLLFSTLHVSSYIVVSIV